MVKHTSHIVTTEIVDQLTLVWDDSRAEHGEGPTLEGVYANRGCAEIAIQKITQGDADYGECFSVDRQEVRT